MENTPATNLRQKYWNTSGFAIGVTQTLTCIGFTAFLVKIAVGFNKIFKDFGTELSGFNLFVINLGTFLYRHSFTALFLACLWPFCYVGIERLLARSVYSTLLRHVWFWGTWLLIFAVMPVFVYAVWCPFEELIFRLSH